ncbi:hypothetical protein NPIL_309571 [Nephila pilipes]|uniref:Uncharacterized protein n=1 Tax=Nephila pilipes TaxID=299642 RepID=A0A8X6MWB5_NEPPI|nr:hypothetical protein NPIL_309571 [Nephila pilipes]
MRKTSEARLALSIDTRILLVDIPTSNDLRVKLIVISLNVPSLKNSNAVAYHETDLGADYDYYKQADAT